MKSSQLIVIKLGTSLLTNGTNRLDLSNMIEIVRQCHELIKQGHRIIVVTSGAIAAGREALNYPQLSKTISSKQLLAAVGQSELIQKWKQLFSIYHLSIGQILLTRADVEDKERFLNAQDVFKALIDNQIIPIVNENDAVATAEIKVGDNDNLSALTAILTNADQLILLTDQKGLFTSDPRKNPEATLIEQVQKIDHSIKSLATDSISGLGTGGMSTKIEAAEVATKAGISVVVARGFEPNILLEIMNGEGNCTRFLPQTSPLEHRKHWLLAAIRTGKIILDDGAVIALKEQGRSLLPKGITLVAEHFNRGDVIEICDSNNQVIAIGVSHYRSEDIQKIAGHHSNEITSLIGYEYGSVVVHRNDLVIL